MAISVSVSTTDVTVSAAPVEITVDLAGVQGAVGPGGIDTATPPLAYDIPTQAISLEYGTGLALDGSDQLVPDFGTGAGKVTEGDDARLSDERTPLDGSVTDAKITAGGLAPSSVAGTAVITTDPRLSDSRAPSGSAGGALAGTYPDPTLASVVTAGTATKVAYNAAGQVTAGTVLAASDIPAILPSQVSGTAVITTDPRLSDSRAPLAHAASHGVAGDDPVSIAASQVAGTAIVEGDPRLSDARTPAGTAGGGLTGTYPDPTLGAASFGTAVQATGTAVAAGTALLSAHADHVHSTGLATVGTAQLATEVITALNYAPQRMTDTGEPTGFVDRTASTLSYDAANRRVTLTAGSSGYRVYHGAVATDVGANVAKSVVHDNTVGTHFVYLDTAGTLQKSMTPWDIRATAAVPVAVVYWNGSDGVLLEERHGVVMDGATHAYLHETVGTQIVSGFAMTGYNTQVEAPADSDNDYSVETGYIDDEDLHLAVTALTSGTNAYRVWSRTGSGAWTWTTTSHPVLVDGTSAMISHNQLSGGTWSSTTLTTGQYVNYWVLATNALTTAQGIIVVQGQQVYSKATDAEAETWDSLSLGASPPWTEFGALYRVTLGTSDGYATTGKYRIESVTDGQTALTTSTVTQVVTGQVLYPDTTASDLLVPSVTGTFSTVNSNPDTITRTSGSFVTDGFVAGQKITMSGWANAGNNATFTIAIVAANTITLITADALTAESNKAGVTITAVRKRLSRTPTTIAEQDATVVVSTADGNVTLDTFLAPVLGVTNIPAGPWNFHTWVYASTANTVSVRFQVLKVDGTTGAATTLFTTNPTLITATTLGAAQEVQQTYLITTAISLLTTDRIAIRPLFSSASNSRTAHFVYGGAARATHVETTLLAAGVSLPSGGSSGTVLAKKSSSDFDVEWSAAPSGITLTTGQVTGLDTALSAKAPLNSPTFTGTPAAPTAVAGTNTTQIATTAFVTGGLAAKLDTAVPHPLGLPMIAGAYHSPPGMIAAATTTAEAVEYPMVFIPARSCTIDRIGVYVVTTAGSTGAVIRLGLRAWDTANNRPGALLADGSTVDATTTGAKEVTVSVPVTAGTPYCVTATVQGGATTRPTIFTQGTNRMQGHNTSIVGNALYWGKASVTGSLGDTGTWTVDANYITPRLSVRTSA